MSPSWALRFLSHHMNVGSLILCISMRQWRITKNQVYIHVYIGSRCHCIIHRNSSWKSHLHQITTPIFESRVVMKLNDKGMLHPLYSLFILTWQTQFSSVTLCVPCHIRSHGTWVHSSYGERPVVIMLKCHMWRLYKIKFRNNKANCDCHLMQCSKWKLH